MTFSEVIAGFIQQVYLHGLSVPRQLAQPQALGEAIDLLAGYRVDDADGYEAAYVEAMNPGNDYTLVISFLAEAIRQRERLIYTRWVFASHLAGDFEARCRIAEALLRRWAPFLESDPARYVDELPNLIMSELRKEDKARRSVNPH